MIWDDFVEKSVFTCLQGLAQVWLAFSLVLSASSPLYWHYTTELTHATRGESINCSTLLEDILTFTLLHKVTNNALPGQVGAE